MKKLCTLLFLVTLARQSFSQVLNPSDTIKIYNPLSPPKQPAYGTIGKWVITRDITSWTTDSYKSYIYKGMAFRLKFPHSYQPGVNDGKKYPMTVFFHGLGEARPITDNDLQLIHGGQNLATDVDNGSFDGFVLYPQNTIGFFQAWQFDAVVDILNYMAVNNKLDINRLNIQGLSAGGSATWDFFQRWPNYVASAIIYSAAAQHYEPYANLFRFAPIWLNQGSIDQDPTPFFSQELANVITNAGGSVRYVVYPGVGHDTWDPSFADTGYVPFLNRGNMTNPTVLYQRSAFCPGQTFNIQLGVMPGFAGYQWRKNGVLITGQTSNILNVNSLGVYDCRFLRGSTWSEWSPAPANIHIQPPTLTPNVQLAYPASVIYPSPDSSTGVPLTVPGNFVSYQWSQPGSSTIISTQKVFKATTPGQYQVQVTQQYGCSSVPSQPFTVVAAGGQTVPSPVSGLVGFAPSYTSVALQWTRNSGQTYPETGYEVYRASSSNGPFGFVALTAPGASTYTDGGLNPNSRYYYKIRAVNNTGSSTLSNVASVLTQTDLISPASPANLAVNFATANAIQVSWGKATDNVGIYKYDIYVNNQKTYIVDSTTTTFLLSNLTPARTYTIFVRARDLSGNVSPACNQVTAFTRNSGLTFKYFNFTPPWNTVQNLNALVPTFTGITNNIGLSSRTQDVNFAYLWSGTLYVPIAGNYTIGTNSDDGSNLYIDEPYFYGQKATVGNDGLHGGQSAETTLFLTAGPHTITVTFFQAGSGFGMQLYWRNTPISGITGPTATAIADNYFVDPNAPQSTSPSAPTNFSAVAKSYNKIQLSWQEKDSTKTLTGFEITRSGKLSGPYTTVATLSTQASAFTDSVGLKPSTTYYYQIRSIGSSGQSSYVPVVGLYQQYYASNSGWPNNNLPDFNALTPTNSRYVTNVSLTSATQTNNFAFKWSGKINVPISGNYTFQTVSDDGSKLYIDQPYGFGAPALVNNDGPHAPQAAQGSIFLTKGVHQIVATYDQLGGGYVYSLSWNGGNGTNLVPIPDSVFSFTVNATTLPLPAVPATPTNLVARAVSFNKIVLSWSDTTTQAQNFAIYRSATTNTNYTLLAKVVPIKGTTYQYTDSSLFTGVAYFYKVVAQNVGGNSQFSSEVQALTPNLPPVFSATMVKSKILHYGTSGQIFISALDPENEKISFSGLGLPLFASIQDYGNGSGVINLNPARTDSGSYKLIISAFNGVNKSYDTIALAVGNLVSPAITPIANVNVNTMDSLTVPVTSTFQPGDSVIITSNQLPAFASLVSLKNGSSNLVLKPGMRDGGNYAVTITANDPKIGSDTKSFTISVGAGVTNRVYIDFSTHNAASAPWNNANSAPFAGLQVSNLANDKGSVTSFGYTVTSNWAAIGNLGFGSQGSDYGYSSGNNSGIFPDNVLTGSWWTTTIPQTIVFNGLKTNAVYDFTLIGSAKYNPGWNDVATYTINGNPQTLNGYQNINNTVTFRGQVPDASGHIQLTIVNANPGSTSFAYLNAVVMSEKLKITSLSAPFNLAAVDSTTGAKLSWSDTSSNLSGFTIYRSVVPNDTNPPLLFTLLGGHSMNFTDTASRGFTTYYYKVKALSGTTRSTFSNQASINTGARNPSLTLSNGATVGIARDTVINFSASSKNPGAVITLAATNLPSFAQFSDLGQGRGRLEMNPLASDIGIYHNVIISASDNQGGQTVKPFLITVVNKSTTTILVNFDDVNQLPVSLPWNNTNAYPNAGVTVKNLVDQNLKMTTVGLTLLNGWTASSTGGQTSGNNAGIYPDSVLQTLYYYLGSDTIAMKVFGLNTANKYNFTFFAGYQSSTSGLTNYVIGNQKASLEPDNNFQNTVSILGVSPDVNGQLIIKIVKASSATYAILNAMTIQSYAASSTPLAPSLLKATAASSSSIQLKWQDRSGLQSKFYILRAASGAGPFNLIDSVPGNVTQYTNTGLANESVYFYEVKGVLPPNASLPSNVASASTLGYQIYVRFSADNLAPAPWNSTNNLQPTLTSYPGLIDDNGNATQVSFSIVKNFSGYNNLGVNTGNNSGIFPDLITQDFYYVQNAAAQVKFSNLDVTKGYDFTFFGSFYHAFASSVTAFSINGNTVLLDPNNNTRNTVALTNILPDTNGEITITVAPNGTSQQYGIVNAIVLNSHQNISDPNNRTLLQADGPLRLAGQVKTSAAMVYPNPFSSQIHVSLNHYKGTKYRITVYDIRGQVVFQDQEQHMNGTTALRDINLSGSGLPTGVYFVRIESDGVPSKTVRILKP